MERLRPDLYRLGSGGAAALHLVMGDVTTLVDAGAPGRGPAVQRELAQAGIRIDRIVFTHGDPDHVGASDHLRAVTGAQVWAAVGERAMLDRSAWPALPRRRRFLLRLFFRGAPPPTVDRWFAPGDDLGGPVAVPSPGHSPGHMAFEWQGWLLAGDAFVSGNRFRESPGIFNLDRDRARQSIEELAARQPESASSSHGRPADRATERLDRLIATWR
jgi:hydroxyacylglutathione hydrolase